jgi:hypothetical protein
MGIERRRAVRYQFGGVAEVVHVESGMQLIGPASILSLAGCFVRTKTGFGQGSSVRLRITHSGVTFAAVGEVVNVTDAGMGIAFSIIEPNEQTVLEKWLTQAAR